ncbi:oxygenase MpaB family protein [Sphingobium chlorophenolicum]|uniref:ER-bound oxygenase mpaB/mpaB'/Rubber oxygenase catalytic domain-containing protein n=1 Tax=Sphingobium chlorophenolicum TaxID=46429 RepID=A0A081R9X8_SPHCR|nr:oxygenase MpaB family protein [Sphingobium chlorophenolicum]KEQ52001.1 hypothetical protein BV95_03752 [Sphingobium chlorophenolicum]
MSGSVTEEWTDLAALRQVSDALADAAIAEATAAGAQGNMLLDRAVRHGVEADTPPAARALIEDAQRLDWADRERLKRGSDAYLAIGTTWLGLALGPGSLTHTYSSPSIARVLVDTANLTRMARRRLLETGSWNIATALPDGLLPGHDGYVHNLQVRLLHARVRHGLLKKGWNTEELGLPINQFDMIRTWLDFTYVPFGAFGNLGVDFTEAELADLYHLWQVAAHILGIDDAIVRAITDQRSAKRLLDAIHAEEGQPNADSRRLTAAMLDALSDLLAPGLGVSPALARKLAAATLRRLHGGELAEQLGVGWNWTSLVLPFIAAANRFRRWRERRNPALRAATIAAAIHTHHNREEVYSGPTTYERAASQDASLGLPETQDA